MRVIWGRLLSPQSPRVFCITFHDLCTSPSWNLEQLKKLQQVAKVLETLYGILARPIHDLVLVIPPPPLIKVALLQYKTMLKTWRSNFEWTGGRRSVLYLTDLWLAAIRSKKDRFRRSVSTFLQLAVVLSKLTKDFKTTYARQKHNHGLWIWVQEWPPTVADPGQFIIFGLKLGGGGGLIFKPNWGPKSWKNFFGRPPHPPLLRISRSGSGTDPYWQMLVDIVRCLQYPIAPLFVRCV